MIADTRYPGHRELSESNQLSESTRSPLYHPRINLMREPYKAGIPRDLRDLDKLEPGLVAPV